MWFWERGRNAGHRSNYPTAEHQSKSQEHMRQTRETEVKGDVPMISSHGRPTLDGNVNGLLCGTETIETVQDDRRRDATSSSKRPAMGEYIGGGRLILRTSW